MICAPRTPRQDDDSDVDDENTCTNIMSTQNVFSCTPRQDDDYQDNFGADFGVLDAVLGEILGGRVTWPIDFHEASHLPMFTSCVDVVLDVIFDVSWTSENRTSITSDTEETTRLVRA